MAITNGKALVDVKSRHVTLLAVGPRPHAAIVHEARHLAVFAWSRDGVLDIGSLD